jgi:hypothetical protein
VTCGQLIAARIESGSTSRVSWGIEGETMFERKLSIAEVILIAGTRVALGAGIGLLLSVRLSDEQRKAAGFALALVGGLTTIPLAMHIMATERGNTSALRSVA